MRINRVGEKDVQRCGGKMRWTNPKKHPRYGFNPGSTLGLTHDNDLLAAKAAMNTTMCAVGGGFFGLMYHVMYMNQEGFDAVMGLCTIFLTNVDDVGVGPCSRIFRDRRSLRAVGSIRSLLS